MKFIITIITSLCFAINSMAAETRNSSYGQYNMSYLTMVNGLPNNYVSDIYPDSFGFLWVSTYGGGLVRYDGYGFSYPELANNMSTLISNSCRNVVEDHFRRLWVSFDEGTSVIDLNTMRPVTPHVEGVDLNKILKEHSVRTYCDSKGKIWLVTSSHVYHFDFDADGNICKMAKYKYVSNTPDIRIKDIDGDGNVWAAIDGGLYKLIYQDGKLIRASISQITRKMQAAFITDFLRYDHAVWIGTNIGLYRYDLNSRATKFYSHSIKNDALSHDYVSSLAVSSNHQLLVGTLCGINIYHGDTDDFEHWDTHSSVNPLNSDFIHSMLSWNGLLFVGTETGGINKLSPRQLVIRNYIHGNEPQSISPNPVNAMYVEPDGTLWAGTVEGGLNIKKPGTDAFVHFTKSNSVLSHNSVSTLAADNQRRMWIGTWGGGMNVISMDAPYKIQRCRFDDKYSAILNFIGALVYDRINDGLWIGSNDGLFFYNFKTKKIEEPFPSCRILRGCIGSIIDKDGNLWVGCLSGVCEVYLHSRKNGRGYFRQRNLEYKLDNPESGVIDKITSFCQSRDGSLWMGSNCYGLYHRVVDHGRERFLSYTVKDGLANNSVKGIVEDNKGNLWITTGNGLSQFNPDKKSITNFTEKDGLISSQFYWNSAIMGRDGTIYLGSEKGLSAILSEHQGFLYKGRLCFTNLAVDNQDILAGSGYIDKDISNAEEINLHEGNKSFSISFSALTYGSETQGVYSYRMKGFENDWIQLPPGQHAVRYTSLPSGKYVFEVKYSSTVSPMDRIISVGVNVSPFFWKSWWFVSLFFLFLLLVCTYLYNRRIIELKRREAETLLRPIEKLLEESDDASTLQIRIQNILDNQQHYRESYSKSAETDLGQLMHKKHLKPFMDRVMEVMEQNYSKFDFGITEFSEAMDMSSSQLAKKLNAEIGISATQFIREYRLRIAKELILKNPGNQNISDIAFSVGFNDPKYFSRCFTKLFGCSPSKIKF